MQWAKMTRTQTIMLHIVRWETLMFMVSNILDDSSVEMSSMVCLAFGPQYVYFQARQTQVGIIVTRLGLPSVLVNSYVKKVKI